MKYLWEVVLVFWWGTIFALVAVFPLVTLINWIMTSQYFWPKENVGVGLMVGFMLLVISFFVSAIFDNGD